jgi:hypothetical protein
VGRFVALAVAHDSEPADNLSVVEDQHVELLDDLLAPIPRKAILPAVEAALGVWRKQADAIVQAFDDYVARPLEANLKKLRGRDLPAAIRSSTQFRGIESVDEWADHVLADKETSALEGHIGTFLEQVARIVSGGMKPGSGVDLQLEDEHGVRGGNERERAAPFRPCSTVFVRVRSSAGERGRRRRTLDAQLADLLPGVRSHSWI